MAPSLRSSAKVPRRAARLATARIEQSSLKYKLLIRQSQWPSSGDLSSQRGVQPSNLQHATQKVPRPTGDSSTQKVPKAVGSHLENSDDDVDVPAQSSKKPKSQESPDRVLQQPVLKSDTEYSDDVDDLVQSRNAKLQKLRDTVPKKPMSKSDAEESDDVDDLAQSKKPGSQESQKVPRKTVLKSDTDDVAHPTHSKKAKLQKSCDRGPQKTVLKSDTEYSDDVDDPTHCKKVKLQKSSDRGPRKTVLKSDTENSDDVDDPTHCKKAKLQKSSDRGPRKTVLKSDTEDSDDIDDPTHSKKAKLQKSCDRGPRKTVLKSDTEDSDDVDDPTHSEEVKSKKLPDQVPRKPTLRSINRANRGMQLRQPGKVDLKRSSRLAGKLKEPQNTCLQCKHSLGETAQTSKGHRATFKPISSSSGIIQQRSSRLAGKLKEPQNTCLQSKDSLGETAQTSKVHKATFKPISSSGITPQAHEQVPAGIWHSTTMTIGLPLFRKPDGKTRNRQYKCSVKGCPHTSNDHIGFWLFSLPDEEDEASLHSAWLQSVPIDLDINRPLSPRVCFKHFDVKKDFVSVCKRMVGLKPTAVPSKVPRKGHQSQSMTAAEATQKLEFTIDTDVGRGSQTTTATDRGNELESTTVVAMNHESRPTTGAGKGQESEPVSIVGTAQESQTMTAASMDSESQCTSAITSPPELASDSNSKSAAESWPTLQASPAQLTGENSGAGQLKKDDVCASPVSGSTESTEAAKHCPTVITESLLQTEDTNTGTCEPLASDSDSEKCGSTESTKAAKHCPTIVTESLLQTEGPNTGTCEPLVSDSDSEKCALESVPMQATNGSKPEEQKRDGACSLASHGPVDDAGSTTASHCASPEGNRDSDVDSNVCGLPKCVPKKMCDALTQPVLVTDNETQDAMLSKLQIDLEAPPQVSKDAVASSVSVQMCSTNKRADASNDRMDKEGMKITTERHNLDPQHVKSDHKSDASITAIRTAAKVHPTLDAPTKPLLRKEVTVSNVAMLSRGPSNLVHSINSEMKRNEQDGICKSRLPNFFSQSYGSDRRDDRHVSSHAFNLPVVKAAVDAKSWPNVSEEPSASCSAIVRHRPDFPGGSSTDEAEKSKPTNPATASHLFDPSQGRYVLKKEVLQDGDELGMSAVLCTVVWVPKGGAN
ncbi:uncharacterized protein LOC119463412 isoform X11 [Dermacentor silvarum]|uniref:uncharacterized protein LOC119463412 isoform X11 n=1 Tax=Dermacentor silvarum TaxID=543639 RepID=UPI002100CAAB|nr:uncharacterized protein LOC119463412 isoform X11 [Dermacentor silvarum]